MLQLQGVRHTPQNLRERLDGHKQSTPRAGEGLPAGAAHLGRAALQNRLLELQDALSWMIQLDVEGVRHDEMACEMRCPWYCRNERAQQVGTWCCRGWCVWRPRARAAAGSGRGGRRGSGLIFERIP